MIPILIAVGAMYLLLRDSEEDNSETETLPDPNDFDPSEYPDTLEEVWSNDDGLVKVWKVGIAMGRNSVYEYHYTVGNADGSSFVSESQAGTGKPRIKRFSTKQKAIDYILDAGEEPSPVGPEAEPEDDDEPTPPPNLEPDYGLGGGFTNLSTGAF